MSILEAIVLGLIQGITEFLPISSSAHLVLLPWALGWQDAGLRFAVVTNAATLLAAILYFRHDLAALLRAAADRARDRERQLLWAVLIGSVPVALAGWLGYGWLRDNGRDPALIAWTSIGFGLLLGWVDRRPLPADRDLGELRWWHALTIGAAQALALIPGTSRSGVTMTAGMALGFPRHRAARFSFLLAIPVGVMALVNSLLDLAAAFAADVATGTSPSVMPSFWASFWPMFWGFAVAGISAYLAIDGLLRWLRAHTMAPFVAYRIVLGLLILAVL